MWAMWATLWLAVAAIDGAWGECAEGQCHDQAGLFQIDAKRGTATLGSNRSQQFPGIPIGTNLGGWLCLEDWFFSGNEGRFVSTTDPKGQGVCLPPLLQGGKEPWPSEGMLVQRLVKQHGKELAAQVFEAHRNSFVSAGDLEVLADLGIKIVRIPVVWSLFADALAPLAEYGKHNPQNETVVVPDPFYYQNASLVTIPRQLLENLLAHGNQLGLKFLLDLHAFPGGSSDGTYNGIWPLKPVFWKENIQVGDKKTSLQKAGMMIYEKAIEWMESLEGDAFQALEGISPMNEPGHLAGFQSPTWATPDQILGWLSKSIQIFKDSELPLKGKRLYMQIIETAFPDNSFWDVVPDWWNEQTSPMDRDSWAVLDMHWYTAWGTKGGVLPDRAAVACNEPVQKILEVLRPGIEGFAKQFAEKISGQKACTEFSASTNADALLACQDVAVTMPWLQAQVNAMMEQRIAPFFWSFKMPYGTIFESGWSLRKIFGMNVPPPFRCETGAGLLGPDATVPCFAGSCGDD